MAMLTRWTRDGTRCYTQPAALAVDEQSARVFVATLGHLAQGNATGLGSVSVLDARNGRLLRMVHAGVWPESLAIDSATKRVFVVNNPAHGTGSVTVLDATSGRRLRTVAVGQFPSSAFVDVLHGHVFVGSAAGVAMLDARNGRVLRVVPIAPDPITTITSVVAVDERRGRAIALTGSSLSILDTRDGRLVQTLAGVADSSTVAPDERSGRVFVLAAGPRYPQGNPKGTGTVSVLDDQSGRLVQTITVGLLPVQVAVDERTGHIFVVNAGCPAPALPCGGAAPADLWGWLPSWLRRWLPWFPVPRRPSTSGTVSMLDVSR